MKEISNSVILVFVSFTFGICLMNILAHTFRLNRRNEKRIAKGQRPYSNMGLYNVVNVIAIITLITCYIIILKEIE